MEFINLAATRRQPKKKSAARRLRGEGRVPGIIYGKEREPEAVAIDSKAFRLLLENGGRLFTIDIEGTPELTLLKDVQWDTFGLNILHVDFSRVGANDTIHIHVPIRLLHVNKLDLHGGTLMVDMHSVNIEARVTAIPSELLLDVEDMVVGHAKTAADLVLPEGAKLLCHETDSIAHIAERRVAEEPVADEAAAPSAAGDVKKDESKEGAS